MTLYAFFRNVSYIYSMKRHSENFGYTFRLILNLQFLEGFLGKSEVTKNLNLEFLTKNLVTFKRWDGVKDNQC